VLDDLRVTPDDALMQRPVDDLARVALVVMKHVTSDHLLDQLARLHEEITRLLATEHGRNGLSGVLWYIECVHPEFKRHAILDRLKPLVGPEIAKTMDSYEKTLERMWVEKHTRLARNEGIQKGEQKLLIQQLTWRFGELPEAITERVNCATATEIERWGKRILSAASLDDVFSAS
jgi:hypothetical protein